MSSYDDLPYESHPYDRTHPDHLAVIGRLFGMRPPDVDRCRVLELGCAAGGNLIPQAVTAPNCEFVGIDLSQRQLESGWELIQRIGLDNIQLKHVDIREFSEDEGEFDYIICHGVYSWVPPDAQAKILEICARQLSGNGIAYISYNTYPGWFMRGMVRQMMCFHARQFTDPTKQVEQARALLDFLINAGPAGDPTYHALLSRELEILRNRADSYLYHEHLEEENEPVLFHEFNDRCERAGLRYLGETQLSEMVAGNFSKQAESTLRELGVGLIHAEQYLDFLRNRTFRRSLVCRDDVELNRTIGPDRLAGLYIGSRMQPAGDTVDLTTAAEVAFQSADGRAVQVSHPLVKAALVELGAVWPGTIRYDELASRAEQRRSGGPAIRNAQKKKSDHAELGGAVIELYANDLIEIRGRPPRFAHEASSHPLASPLARRQAEAGESPWVTNLRHEMTQLSESQLHLIRLLDGSHDLQAMVLAFRQLIQDGTVVVEHHGGDGQQVPDQVLSQLIERDLEGLLQRALVVH